MRDDDDTHFCLRCKTEISGLENYITHRQRNCLELQTKSANENNVVACDSNNEIGYTSCNNEIDLQNASDFFSSLELKCNVSDNFNTSVKKPSTDLFPMTFEYDSDNYVDNESGFYHPPQSHTGGKWEPGTRPDLTNEQWVLRSPSPSENVYECLLCKKTFQEKTALERHFSGPFHRHMKVKSMESCETESKHTEDKTVKFCCEVCNMVLRNEKEFLLHSFCIEHKGKFNDLGLWNKDLVKQQTNAIRALPFQCCICPFHFLESDHLMEHMGEDEHLKKALLLRRTIFCLTCKFEGFNNEEMVLHMLSETHCELVKSSSHSHPVMIIEKSSRFHCRFCNGKCLLWNDDAVVTSTTGKAVVYSCHYCDFTSKSSTILKCHICKEHRKSNRHETLLNQPNFTPKKLHLKRNYKAICSFCNESFGTTIGLKRHFITRHSDKIYNCEKCNRIFISEDDFVRHCETRMHQMRPEKAEVSSDLVNDDTSIKIQENIRVTSELVNETELPVYKDGTIMKEEIIFKCDRCNNFATNSRGKMCLHSVQHDGPVPTNKMDESGVKTIGNVYQCPFCSKEFRLSHLESHVYSHTGEKPFKCRFCNKGFTQKASCKCHERLHASIGNVFKCSICPFKARTKLILDKHKKAHLKVTLHMCDVCGETFSNFSLLTLHTKRHLDKEKYFCKKKGCQSSFFTAEELIWHSESHNHDELTCEVCGFAASSQTQMITHQRLQKHHNVGTAGSKVLPNQEDSKSQLLCGQTKAMYSCKYCKYACCDAKLIKAHLLDHHSKELSEKLHGDRVPIISLTKEVSKPPINILPKTIPLKPNSLTDPGKVLVIQRPIYIATVLGEKTVLSPPVTQNNFVVLPNGNNFQTFHNPVVQSGFDTTKTSGPQQPPVVVLKSNDKANANKTISKYVPLRPKFPVNLNSNVIGNNKCLPQVLPIPNQLFYSVSCNPSFSTTSTSVGVTNNSRKKPNTKKILNLTEVGAAVDAAAAFCIAIEPVSTNKDLSTVKGPCNSSKNIFKHKIENKITQSNNSQVPVVILDDEEPCLTVSRPSDVVALSKLSQINPVFKLPIVRKVKISSNDDISEPKSKINLLQAELNTSLNVQESLRNVNTSNVTINHQTGQVSSITETKEHVLEDVFVHEIKNAKEPNEFDQEVVVLEMTDSETNIITKEQVNSPNLPIDARNTQNKESPQYEESTIYIYMESSKN